jgi:hypothetical protein
MEDGRRRAAAGQCHPREPEERTDVELSLGRGRAGVRVRGSGAEMRDGRAMVHREPSAVRRSCHLQLGPESRGSYTWAGRADAASRPAGRSTTMADERGGAPSTAPPLRPFPAMEAGLGPCRLAMLTVDGLPLSLPSVPGRSLWRE